MLVVSGATSGLIDSRFSQICSFLKSDDLLVLNDSKVVKSRLFGNFESGGGQAEILLLKSLDSDRWIAMGRPLKRFKSGAVLVFGSGLRATIGPRIGEQQVELQFSSSDSAVVGELIEQVALMPIPPYIRNGVGDDQDLCDYQTHFAKESGSVAAPTANLHFTPDLIAKIKAHGCSVEFVTLHVGSASFQSVWDSKSGFKEPAVETYSVSDRLLNILSEAKAEGRRVVAVGTTTVRALESAWTNRENCGGYTESNLFIRPGYEFGCVDAIVTNFHQPGTTHLLLVEAFIGRAMLESAYSHALRGQYRFLSYGDGMILLR